MIECNLHAVLVKVRGMVKGMVSMRTLQLFSGGLAFKVSEETRIVMNERFQSTICMCRQSRQFQSWQNSFYIYAVYMHWQEHISGMNMVLNVSLCQQLLFLFFLFSCFCLNQPVLLLDRLLCSQHVADTCENWLMLPAILTCMCSKEMQVHHQNAIV